MKWLTPIQVTRSNQKSVALKIRRQFDSSKSEALIQRIIERVRRNGDRALLEYVRKFDGATLRKEQLKIPRSQFEQSTRRSDTNLLKAMRLTLRQLEAAQQKLLSRINYSINLNGFTLQLAAKPLSRVGCYVPGGQAAYPSTVLMTAGMAKLAGVSRVVACTPPDSTGAVSDVVLAAADLCGVDEVYRCGGAQAIAALAYGTKSIPRVDKIVGPGGRYVAIAKKLVSVDTPIDFHAGPTELIVVADESTNPRLAAWDLIAQAEHGSDTLTCLVTCSTDAAFRVLREIGQILPTIERRKYVEDSLANGSTAICEDQDTACALVNEIAPEHVELLTENSVELSNRIHAAGLVLIGPFSPAAASDYCVGTSHVLPTGSSARNHGGLSVLDFMKLTWMVTGSQNGLHSILEPLKTLATSERLLNHYLSVQSRFSR